MRHILRSFYLSLFGTFKKPNPGVHILNSHYVTPDFSEESDWLIFEGFVKYLSKHCKLITIQEATQLIAKRQFQQKECLVALTFDDGFEECYTTIAPLLEKYNCYATFFINTNYIESNEKYQQQFHNRIKTWTKKPMTWKQVKELHKRGHVIGSHTLDHANLFELAESEIEYQILENKRILEEKLNYNCIYFAWTFGQLQHFPEEALNCALKYHKYIFSGTNYKQYFSMNDTVINRRHIEAFWPKSHINYFLSVHKK
ncbi:MAG: polysaccharide deacetylase family protein [Mariniphaga sp.]|nr:polysaccharide deacetylase family protein [Mariniphaga sp.]